MKKELKIYLKPQLKKARDLNLDFIADIQISPRLNKKYRAILTDGSYVDYGALGMSDYLIHRDENRRNRFHQRFHNNKGYNNPESGLFYSARLLW